MMHDNCGPAALRLFKGRREDDDAALTQVVGAADGGEPKDVL
jgi:hypothetical protein